MKAHKQWIEASASVDFFAIQFILFSSSRKKEGKKRKRENVAQKTNETNNNKTSECAKMRHKYRVVSFYFHFAVLLASIALRIHFDVCANRAEHVVKWKNVYANSSCQF